METKKCTGCGEVKPLAEFPPQKMASGEIRRRADCFPCRNKRERDRRAGTLEPRTREKLPPVVNKDKVRARAAALGVTQEAIERLMASPCSVCGAEPRQLRHSVYGDTEPLATLCRACLVFAKHAGTADAARRVAALLDGESIL